MSDNDAVALADEQSQPSRMRSRLGLFGLGAAACAACCIGPILAVLGAITAGGMVSARFIGAVGLVVAALAAIAFVIVQRQRRTACRAPAPQPVKVLPTRRIP